MIEPIPFFYKNTPVRAAILDSGIHFVFCDLCRIKGFRAATERAGDKPVYQRIKTAVGSTAVRLMGRDFVLTVLSCMRQMERYADEERRLCQWLMRDVLPELYKRPDCKRFIPRAPWAKPKHGEPAVGASQTQAKPPAEGIQNMLLTQIVFMQMLENLGSPPVVLLCFAGDAPAIDKGKSGNDR